MTAKMFSLLAAVLLTAGSLPAADSVRLDSDSFGSPDVYNGVPIDKKFGECFARDLGMTLANDGHGGAIANDSWIRMLIDGVDPLLSQSPAPRPDEKKHHLTLPSNHAVHVINLGYNDMRLYGNKSGADTELANRLIAMAAYMRLDKIIDDRDLTWSSDWAGGGGSFKDMVGGSNRFTTKNGATVTCTFSGENVTVGTFGRPDAGGTLTVNIDGKEVRTVTNGNRCIGGNQTDPKQWIFNANHDYVPMAVEITGLAPGEHTLTLTKTAGSSYVHVDYIGVRDNKMPQIYVNGLTRMRSDKYKGGAYGNADDAIINRANATLEKALKAAFPDGGVVFVPQENYVAAQHAGNPDGIHPNEAGHRVIADNLLSAYRIQNQPPRMRLDSDSFGSPDVYNGVPIDKKFGARVADTLGIPLDNRGVGGSVVNHAWIRMLTDNTHRPAHPSPYTVHVLNLGFNDMRLYGNHPQADEEIAARLGAMIALLRLDMVLDDSSAALHYAGGWATAGKLDDFYGGHNHYTNTKGATATYTFQGDNVTVGTFGLTQGQGGTMELSVDGKVMKTVSLDGRCIGSGSAGSAYGHIYAPMAVELSGLGPGEHTLTIKKTDGNGKNVYVDYVGTRDSNNPKILVCGMTRMTANGYTLGAPFNKGSDEAANRCNAAIKAMIEQEFDADVVYVPQEDFDAAQHVGQPDNIHPNEEGHRILANNLLKACGAQPIPPKPLMRLDSDSFGAPPHYNPETTKKFGPLTAERLGMTLHNKGQGSSVLAGTITWPNDILKYGAWERMIAANRSHTLSLPSPYAVHVLNLGFNDLRNYGHKPNALREIAERLGAMIAYMRLDRLTDDTKAGFRKTGKWTASGGHVLNIVGGSNIYTGEYNATAACSFEGTHLTVGTFARKDDGGTMEITVDGKVVKTVSLNGRSGNDYAPMAVEVGPFAPGPHELVIRKADNTKGFVHVDYIGTRDNSNPLILVNELTCMTPTGWAKGGNTWNHGNNERAAACNAAIKKMIRENFDADVRFVPAVGYDPAIHVGADDIHPNDAGHRILSDNLVKAYGNYTLAPDVVLPAVGDFSETAGKQIAEAARQGGLTSVTEVKSSEASLGKQAQEALDVFTGITSVTEHPDTPGEGAVEVTYSFGITQMKHTFIDGKPTLLTAVSVTGTDGPAAYRKGTTVSAGTAAATEPASVLGTAPANPFKGQTEITDGADIIKYFGKKEAGTRYLRLDLDEAANTALFRVTVSCTAP